MENFGLNCGRYCGFLPSLLLAGGVIAFSTQVEARSPEKLRYRLEATVSSTCSASLADSLYIGTLTDAQGNLVTGVDLVNLSMFCNAPFQYTLMSRTIHKDIQHVLLSHTASKNDELMPWDFGTAREKRFGPLKPRPFLKEIQRKKTISKQNNWGPRRKGPDPEAASPEFHVRMSLPAVQGNASLQCTQVQIANGNCAAGHKAEGLLTQAGKQTSLAISWEDNGHEAPANWQSTRLIVRLGIKN